MSDTPRTDAILQEMAFIVNQYGHSAALSPKIDELTKLSIQLETELAEARAEIERKDKLIEQMREALAQIAKQDLSTESTACESLSSDVFEDAYDDIVRLARAALEAAERMIK